MKKLCTIITYIAAFAFFLALYFIESLNVGVLTVLLVSGAWLIGACMVYEEKRKISGGR